MDNCSPFRAKEYDFTCYSMDSLRTIAKKYMQVHPHKKIKLYKNNGKAVTKKELQAAVK